MQHVADSLDKHDLTESESLLIGRDFGVLTDIKTGPNGNLYFLAPFQPGRGYSFNF